MSHLAMLFPQTPDATDTRPLPTAREREVLGLVALGERSGRSANGSH